MPKITVIGSSNIDFVVKSDKRPTKGETVLGESFQTIPGGKGANQAVAAAKLGGKVTFLSCVGADPFGDIALENLKQYQIDTTNVERVVGMETGTAHIVLVENDNSIIVVKGANDAITPSYIEKHLQVLAQADIVVMQQENPAETVDFVIEKCAELQVPVLLNPAPARFLPPEVIEQVTYLTPNEHEAEVLFQTREYQQKLAAFANKVFVTEGENGVRYHDGESERIVPTYQVQVVDTTGAGDTFNGAFALMLAEKKSLEEALRFANRAASLSVTGFGAQGGMPTREEVERNL